MSVRAELQLSFLSRLTERGLEVTRFAALLATATATAAWSSGAPLPEPRTEVSAAPLRGEIVVVGGFRSDRSNTGRADAYSPARDTWRRLPDLPVAVDHAAAASYAGRVYVVGGYGADRRPLRTAFAFDGVRWRRLPAPPEPRAPPQRRRPRPASSTSSADEARPTSPSRPWCSTSARSAGHVCPGRRHASILRPPRPAASSTRSRAVAQGSTRTCRPSRRSIRARDAGGAFRPSRRLEAEPELPRSLDGSSRSAARNRPARSATCGPTTSAPAGGRACPIYPRRATGSASLRSVAACGSSPAALARG